MQGDAERMKTLITEDKARFEQKYQSPEVLPSFHNFAVLNNNEKAVQVPNEERRLFLLRASRILYSTSASSATHKKHMAHLWNCVKDPTFQELFYQFLLGVDTSNIVKGQAPHTSFKQRIQAQQVPVAIKFLVDALDDVSIMAKPMADLSGLRQAEPDGRDSGKATFQPQAPPSCRSALLPQSDRRRMGRGNVEAGSRQAVDSQGADSSQARGSPSHSSFQRRELS
jgi:hypothetical protein